MSANIKPTIHLNGTSPKELLELYRNAYRAVNAADAALDAAGPNGRDYYPHGPGVISQAIDEHYARHCGGHAGTGGTRSRYGTERKAVMRDNLYPPLKRGPFLTQSGVDVAILCATDFCRCEVVDQHKVCPHCGHLRHTVAAPEPQATKTPPPF